MSDRDAGEHTKLSNILKSIRLLLWLNSDGFHSRHAIGIVLRQANTPNFLFANQNIFDLA